MALIERKYLLPFLLLLSAIAFQLIFYTQSKYIPKVIWSYWDKDPPQSVIKIVEDNKKALYDWDFYFLNEKTVKNYISEHEFPKEYQNLSPQHKADYIRLLLLKKYGGLWLDASILIFQPESINSMRIEAMKKRVELVAFSLHEPQEVYIENWFIMAPKNSTIILHWFDEFNKAVKVGFLNYKHQALENGYVFSDKIYKNDDNVYLTQHACLQVVRQKNFLGKHNVLLYKSEDSMFKVHQECGWDKSCIKKRVKEPSVRKKIPFVKLRGGDRD